MPKASPSFISRFPMERMFRIHERLKANHYPNAKNVAKDFEVCEKTIKRDLMFMRDRLRLPIEYDPHRYGYFYTEPVETFPDIPLSEQEIFALLVAHKAIEQYRGTPFERPLDEAYRRLSGRLDPQERFTLAGLDEAISFRPFAPGDADLEQYEILTRALREHRVIRFLYQGLQDQRAVERKVHPYHLACIENLWYLFGFDAKKGAMRTFALPRMADVEILPEKFRTPKEFSIEKHLKGALAVYQGKGDHEIVIDFDPWATRLVRERRWHPSQEIEPLPGGGSRLKLHLGGFEEVERWILSWGSHATVIGPEDLKQRVRAVTAELAARYGNAGLPVVDPAARPESVATVFGS